MAENLTNNGDIHGYRWRDGSVRAEPEPPEVRDAVFPRIAIEDHDKKAGKLPHVTQETYDRAYAAWVKDMARWRAAMDRWEAKHGKV